MTTDKKSNPRKTKPLPTSWTGMVIRVLVDKNPKRPGTFAFKKWALLRDGMTVEEYIARPWPPGAKPLKKCGGCLDLHGRIPVISQMVEHTTFTRSSGTSLMMPWSP